MFRSQNSPLINSFSFWSSITCYSLFFWQCDALKCDAWNLSWQKIHRFQPGSFFSMDFICLAWGGLRQKRHREKRGRIFATSPLTPVTTVRLIKNCLIQALFRFTCCYDYAQFPPPAYNFEIGLFVSLPSSRIKAITSLKCLFSFQFYNNTSFAKQLIKITWLYVTFFFYITMWTGWDMWQIWKLQNLRTLT